jgi:fructokinase
MIVSCGEALIDFLPRKDAGGADVFRPFAGGSPFNVAIALSRLGAPAGYFGGLSTDFFGQMLRETLEANGVDLSVTDINDRPTTLAFVSLTGGDARYAFFDEGSAGRMITENDLPALTAEVEALHFGSFSLAAEPCGSALEGLMQGEQRDRVIMLDPNIRPTLIKNRDGYIARLDRLVAMTDIVKVSDDDLEWLAPGATFDELGRRWLGLGAKLVILTRGSGGAVAMSKAASAKVAGIDVSVVDTVGAGDTFTAAFLAGLKRNSLLTKPAIAALSQAQVTEVIAFANKAASITASRAGADPPRLDEVGAV